MCGPAQNGGTKNLLLVSFITFPQPTKNLKRETGQTGSEILDRQGEKMHTHAAQNHTAMLRMKILKEPEDDKKFCWYETETETNNNSDDHQRMGTAMTIKPLCELAKEVHC